MNTFLLLMEYKDRFTHCEEMLVVEECAFRVFNLNLSPGFIELNILWTLEGFSFQSIETYFDMFVNSEGNKTHNPVDLDVMIPFVPTSKALLLFVAIKKVKFQFPSCNQTLLLLIWCESFCGCTKTFTNYQNYNKEFLIWRWRGWK